MRPGKLLFQLVVEPQLGCTRLALRAVPVAACVMDAVVCAPAVARREAVPGASTAAMWDGVEGLVGRVWQRGSARQGLWRKGVAHSGEGGHQASPCRRELRRSEASAWPVWVRCQETMVVARRVWPRDCGRRRGMRPASRRGVAYACRRGWRATPMLGLPARGVA